jgi:uncharacterized membrane-anchored protein
MLFHINAFVFFGLCLCHFFASFRKRYPPIFFWRALFMNSFAVTEI